MAGEGGGADRVEIVSRELAPGEAGCTEVRIAGVIKKCQLTAVREHTARERALNDALDAFERNVAYALNAQPPAQQRREPVAPMGVSGMDASGGAVLSPMERLTDSMQGVLEPVGSLMDRVRDARSSIVSVAGRASTSRAARAVAPSARPKRRRVAGIMRPLVVSGSVFALVGAGLFWYQASSSSLSTTEVLPAVVASTLEKAKEQVTAAVASSPAGPALTQSAPAEIRSAAQIQPEQDILPATSATEDEIAFWAIASVRPQDESGLGSRFSAVAQGRR